MGHDLIHMVAQQTQQVAPFGLPPAVWGFLGLVVTGALTYLGVRTQQKSQNRSADATLIQVTGDEYRQLIDQINRQADRDRERAERNYRELRDHSTEQDERLRTNELQMSENETRILSLETELFEWREWGRKVMAWIGQLPEELRRDAPPPPRADDP